MATPPAYGINNGRKMAREVVAGGAEDPRIVGFAELGMRNMAARAGLGERVRHESNADLNARGRKAGASPKVQEESPRIKVFQAVDLAIGGMGLPLR
jgi:hypothetical protein